jgi:type III secretion protein L
VIAPRPFGRIVPAAEAGLWRSAGEAMEAARREAAASRVHAAETLAAERAALEQTLAADMDRQTAQALAEAAAGAQVALQTLRADIAATITAALRKILGQIDLAEAVSTAATEALAELSARHGVTLHVHPVCATRVRQAVAPWGDGARVVGDETLPHDACTLETEAGIVRAGLSDQLSAVSAALAQAALCHA